jgi:hypothetical protein
MMNAINNLSLARRLRGYWPAKQAVGGLHTSRVRNGFAEGSSGTTLRLAVTCCGRATPPPMRGNLPSSLSMRMPGHMLRSRCVGISASTRRRNYAWHSEEFEEIVKCRR